MGTETIVPVSSFFDYSPNRWMRPGDLTRAKLPMISLEESNLQQANLSSANLAGGSLNHADLSFATLTNANFIAADLVRAKLIGANLSGAVMSGANLSGASFRKADLSNCIFVGANLTGVDFSGAVLKNAVFGGANLKGANLSEVDLTQVELTNLDLTEALLPEGLADELWGHNNRDLSVNFNQTVPGWDNPMDRLTPAPDPAIAEQTHTVQPAMIPEETGRYLFQDNPDDYPAPDDHTYDYSTQAFPTETDAVSDESDQSAYVVSEYATEAYATEYHSEYGADYSVEYGVEYDTETDVTGYGTDTTHDDDSDHGLDDVNALDALDALDAIDALDTSDTLDALDTLDATNALDTTDALDVLDATNALDTSDALDALDATNALDTSDALDVLDATNALDTTNVLDASDALDALDASDALDVLDASDALDVLDATKALDVLDTTDTTTDTINALDALDAIALEGTTALDNPLDPQPPLVSDTDVATALDSLHDPLNPFRVVEDRDDLELVPSELPAEPWPMENTAIAQPEEMDSDPPEDTQWIPSNQATSVGLPAVDTADTADTADAVLPPDQEARPISPPPTDRANQPLNSRVVQSIQAVLGRRVQYSLQRKMLDLYHNRCAITNCDIQPLLETVFIASHNRDKVEHPSQCLVLRADIKTLYDLKLLAIHPEELTVLLSPQLLESDYGRFQGHSMSIPDQKIYQPSPKSLAQHLQDCTWYDDHDHHPAQPRVVASSPPQSGRPQLWVGRLPLLAALGIGMIAGVGLGWPLHQILSARPDSEPAGSGAQVSPQPQHPIHIQAGDLRYHQQGVILDEKAYIALDQAQQLGLPIDDVPETYQRQYQGQTYLQLSHLATLGVPVSWDAQTRTAILDCCQDRDLERISLAVNNRTWPEAGLIVDHRAYVPRQRLADLALDLDRLNPAHAIDYQNETYVRASDLKDLAATVQWDAETRVLSLRR